MIRTHIIPFQGGLNLDAHHLSIKDGQVIEALNVEPDLNGGYSRIQGYERLDGRAAPSDAVWYLMTVDDGTDVSLGAITGSLSSATANVVAIDGNDICITNLTGNFQVGDLIPTADVTIVEQLEGQSDPSVFGVWELAAQDYYRDLITAVAGTGNVLGVWHYNDVDYAFRSNGSVVKMYKSSASGWVEVTHFRLMEFDTGVLADGGVVAGDTVTGLTSSASGVVKAFVKSSGAYGSTAAGYIVVDVTSGTFQVEDIQKSAATVFTSTTTADQIEFAIGTNNFEFVNYNFRGDADSIKMYGCDGVNRGFEFDGTTLIPILTGMTTDAPLIVEAHKKHLFFAFARGSLQHSGVGDPLIWNPILGAAEIAVGDEITGIDSITGDAMIVGTDRAIHALYGSDSDTWNLSLIASNAGDVGRTLDVLGSPYVVTKNGITRIDAVQAYGNFSSSTVSRLISPLLNQALNTKTLIGVSVSRAKNQYKIFFADGTGILMHYDALYGQGALPEFTTFMYEHNPTTLCSVALDGADEKLMFGDDQGYVYQEYKGHSFDGEAIEWALRLPFSHLKSPSMRKGFKRYELETDVDRNADIRVSYEFSYGQSHTAQSGLDNDSFIGGGGYWNSDNWDEFNWTADEVNQKIQSMTGTGHNVSILFYGNSATNAEFTLNNLIYHYFSRRLNRG